MEPYYKDQQSTLHLGDCRVVLGLLDESSVDSIVTDPPYEIGFMGKKWDGSGIANDVNVWREALRVLKPGGHLLAFSGARTYHRMVCAIEDAGFEIRDQIMWVYGQGFPKSLDVKKAIEKTEPEQLCDSMAWCQNCGEAYVEVSSLGTGSCVPCAARPWVGWGTALKPAHEPIVMARKPLIGTVAGNTLLFGLGGINIDACRVDGVSDGPGSTPPSSLDGRRGSMAGPMDRVEYDGSKGRWPANLIHDGSDEVLDAFPDAPGQQGDLKETGRARPSSGRFGDMGPPRTHLARDKKAGSTSIAVQAGRRREATSAARFFYCPKTTKADRGEGNKHPTVKPTELMRYLCRLVTPIDGTVLDFFAGSGSTGKAAVLEGFNFIGGDMSEEYLPIQVERIKDANRMLSEGRAQ